jgi:hypothetical protein
MCDQCEKLKEKIARYRPFLNQQFDPLTEGRIKALIADLERQKETMHSSAALFSPPERSS